MLTVRARALLDGRFAPSLDDVEALADPGAAAPHGGHLRGARADGVTVRDLISNALKAVL